MATTTSTPGVVWNWAQIPAWEISSLQNLAANNQLHGVPPQVMAVIVEAESSGKGGGLNSEGYGGFFGIGANKTYPGGVITSAQMKDPSPASFAAQAQVASSAFASYLTQTGGNPVTAEQLYQTGSTNGSPSEGARLMSMFIGGATITPSGGLSGGVGGGTGAVGTATAPASAGGSNFPDCTKAVIGEGGILGIGAETLLNECQAQEIVGAFLIIGGGIVAVVGLGILLADLGLHKGATAIVSGVVGDRIGKASAAKSSGRPISRSRQRNLEGEAARNRGQTPAAYRKATAPSTRTVDANRAGTTMDF